MDEFLCEFDMYFHPLMELNHKYIHEEKMLPRKHIKILSYNIFLRPPPVKNNENDWKDERMADFIKNLDLFDIICLQEMFGTFNNRKQELIKYANKSGLFFYCDSPSPSFFSKFLVDAGLLILSRFPIVESDFRPYKYCVLSDSLSNKGVLYAKIKVGNSYLAIFNTHLQASYFGSTKFHWDISVKTRLDHIQELCDYIYEILQYQLEDQTENGIKEVNKALLVGDFNVDAHNYEKKKKIVSTNYQCVDEYKFLLKKLNEITEVKDIIQTQHNFHPYTFGYNGEELIHYDHVLTDKEDYGSFQTLDYMFEIITNKKNSKDRKSLINNSIDILSTTNHNDFNNPNQTSNSKNTKVNHDKMYIDYSSSEIEYFLVTGKPYQQLSDHFGLSVNLVIN